MTMIICQLLEKQFLLAKTIFARMIFHEKNGCSKTCQP